MTPPQAFDALYESCVPALVRQTYLLTGRPLLARESVEQAFQQAWRSWPEVAVDPDPAGWVRAAAHDWALAPWHRFRPRHRQPGPPPADPDDRALLHALLTLPPAHRRTLLLYDGVGLGLPEAAAETQASTPVAAGRLLSAREALTVLAPDQAAPPVLHRRLSELATAQPLRAARPPTVRTRGERRTRRWTAATFAFTTAIVAATTLTLRIAEDHYERPVARGTEIRDLPTPGAEGPLSEEQQEVRALLESLLLRGPERLVPEAR
ncbi:RNA polymerase sigma factor [Streptomyces gibsoniae]|uniref:RNA polymerase subunit sigma-70 n=1 Tax=Streptomyces gibsoniae TaxID=3075529 RepID=A0ABU2TLI2_9ACTN|nr:RNA polymerase subunit sigma-70 [Streptomyces sp. DSM 41699]MDT0461800.1 RNA polymerase subunit sigma-70 [Streptomyces sp. DSM 41699]